MPQGSTLGMDATLKNESPVGDTYTEKNPRFVPEGRWRMPRPSGTGFFTIYLFCNFGFYQDGDGRYEKEKYITRFTYTLLLSQLTAIIKGCSL